MGIVTTTYRYKRPPKRKKPVAIPHRIVTPSRKSKLKLRPAEEAQETTPPVNDDRKPTRAVIVTPKRKPGRPGVWPDISDEELQRRTDAADRLWRAVTAGQRTGRDE